MKCKTQARDGNLRVECSAVSSEPRCAQTEDRQKKVTCWLAGGTWGRKPYNASKVDRGLSARVSANCKAKCSGAGMERERGGRESTKADGRQMADAADRQLQAELVELAGGFCCFGRRKRW